MSNIKDLFSGKKSDKLLENATQRSVGSAVESPDYLKSNIKDKKRFLPHVDFSSASNFAIYGSAEKYYEDAYNYVLNEYPYDGSLKEKINWSLSGTYLDRYIFENEYPRTTGYINFGQSYAFSAQQSQGYDSATKNEWIYFKGHNTSYSLNSTTNPELTLQFDNLNVYNTASQGLSNLELEGSGGVSVEFWLNKPGFDKASESRRQVILDVWNSGTFGTTGYGRFRVEISGTEGNVLNPNFQVELLSGSAGFSWQGAADTEPPVVILSGSTLTGSWNHFALTFANTGSQMVGRLYTNGALTYTYTGGTTIGTVTGSMLGQIGSLIAPVSGGSEVQGYGKLSGSLDEFRFWKTRRTATQIGQHWFTQVGGGTNTDLTLATSASTKYSYENPADLGVYYKFNEGIINTSSVNSKDAVVIDYAGRVTNGEWNGYTITSRNTGSAIVSASVASSEFADPILYSTHPLVSSSLNDKKNVGKLYDATNNSSMFDSLPQWITSEDQNDANGTLKNLTQIMSSYFDTLYLQTQAVTSLKNKDYISGSDKPFPFANRFIDSSGFLTSEIFTKASDLEYLDARNNKKLFTQKVNELKNLIYQNVYNNLVYVYKTKGTMKSFRNLIRCFGVDSELINIRLYGDQVTYKLQDNYEKNTIRKKYANFHSSSNTNAVVLQQTASGNSYSRGYISSSAEVQYRGNTYELESFFPKDKEKGTEVYFTSNFVTASIFGCHTSGSPGTTWGTYNSAGDAGQFQVQSVRTDIRRKAAFFQLTCSNDGLGVIPKLTSSVFQDVYDGTRWNFAVRIKPKKYPLAAGVSGSDNGQYDVEFSGYNYVLDVLNNSFAVTASMAASDAQNFLKANKRFFVGAHRTNTTGTVLQQSNIKASSLRVWMDYLTSSVLQAHAKDVTNFGSAQPYRDAYITEQGANLGSKAVKSIPQLETLILNWDFATVSASDSGGNFTVQDTSIASSGSNDYTGRWGWLGPIGQYQHTGYGFGFGANASSSVDERYVHTLLQQPPEVINSTDMISLIDEDKNSIFVKDSRPEQYYFAFEKSMYNIITKEMLDIFGTIVDFNNLIGEPVNRYRQEYKSMQKLRQLYFERVQNTIDLDKFVEYFKWLDSALSVMLQQLVPGSARFSENLRTMVESHVLERNKYWSKFPTLEMKQSDPEAGVFGINEMLYSGKRGIAPIPTTATGSNCEWWLRRANRDNSNITSGDSTVDSQRDDVRLSDDFRSGSGPTLAVSRNSTATTTTYEGQAYALRNFTKIYRLAVDESLEIHGGSNFPRAKTVEYTHEALKFGSSEQLDIAASSIPAEIGCDDVIIPNSKDRLEAKVANSTNPYGYTSGKSEIFAPFSLYSSSVTTGYVADVSTNFRAKTEVDNYHDDVYGDDKGVPVQGPFTDAHVGGRQHRHININSASTDTTDTRPEAWDLSFASNVLTISQRGVDQPRATMIRDEYAKRPLNIRNIKWGTSSAVVGNYTTGYQILQTSGRRLNNRFFVKNGGFSPTSSDTGIFSGAIDYALPRFDLTGTNKSIFVERFNAPGGPEVSPRGAMDVNAEEYSVYNELNYRNLIVREALDSWLTEHCGQFGIDPTGSPGDGTTPAEHTVNAYSYDGVIASYHKVNRNPWKVPADGASTCSINYDNWYIQHPIPQSDFQYAWITSSVSKSACNMLGHIGAHDWGGIVPFSVPSGTTSITQSAIPFISASVTGALGISADFVGLNSLIYEPLTSSTNLLGYPLDARLGAYRGQVASLPANSGTVLNSLNLHRNGPYQHPTWKQIRTGETPIARYHKNNNILSVGSKRGVVTVLHGSGTNRPATYFDPRTGPNNIKNFVEPPVTFKYRALTSRLQNPKISLRHSYGNNKCLWTQRWLPLNQRELSIAEYLGGVNYKSDIQIYDKLRGASDYQAAFQNLIYPEVIYPRGANTGLAETRGRTKYAETASVNSAFPPTASLSLGSNGIDRNPDQRRTLWRNADYNRNRYVAPDLGPAAAIAPAKAYARFQTTISNSCGNQDGQARSVWCFGEEPLVWYPPSGSPDPAVGLDVGTLSASSNYANNNGQDTGELNSINIYKLGGLCGGVTGSILENAWSHNFYIKPSASAFYYWLPYYGYELYCNAAACSDIYGYIAGDAPQTASAEFCKGMKWTAARDSGKNPWFDSYEDYAEDIRGLSKAWTVLPEFRISDNMEYYTETKDSFFAKNDKFLLLNGGNITQSADVGDATPSNTNIRNFDRNFFKEYSFSDFQKYFGTFAENNKLEQITLKCTAVKKLLPYKGFYPSDRSTQLVSLFSGALGQYVTGGALTWSAGVPTNADPRVQSGSQQLALQTLLQPWFAPGILYNTIKSGVAVDWPVFTGSIGLNTIGYGEWGYQQITGTATTRFPFKSLLDPLDYTPAWKPAAEGQAEKDSHRLIFNAPSYYNINHSALIGSEPGRIPFATFSSSGPPPKSVTNLYRSAMHNYLAEIPNFFLKNQSLQYIESLPQGSVKILAGKVYVMDVYIEKTNTAPNNELIMIQDYYNGYVSASLVGDYGTVWGAGGAGVTGSYNGKYFGPKWYAFQTNASPTNNAWYSGAKAFRDGDPAFAPVTPPYFYGKARVRLIYTGSVEDEQNPGAGNGPNLRRIFNNMTMSFKGANDPRAEAWTRYGMVKANYITSPAFQQMMDVTASLELKGLKVENPSDQALNRWVISPHMETPVLDFSSSQTPEQGYGRGMWSGYGEVPINNKGIFFGIERVPNEFLNRQDVEDMTQWFQKAPTTAAGATIDSSIFEGGPSRLPIDETSLTRQIGQIADTKTISEAVVAIPFSTKQFGRNSDLARTTSKQIMGKWFFSLGVHKPAARRNFQNPKKNTSISKLRGLMDKYILPPELDFMKNITIEPFAMYMIEFEHELDRQDLVDIWQGLMPKISTTAELDESSFSHSTGINEFFGGKKLPPSEDIRWMVFKVKKKAHINYWATTPQTETRGFGIQSMLKESNYINPVGLEYSYNWPYDHFSLVELAQVETIGSYAGEPQIAGPLQEAAPTEKRPATAAEEVEPAAGQGQTARQTTAATIARGPGYTGGGTS
jgi:hypothetical protein